jgi:phage protein D
MVDTSHLLSQFYVTIDGTDASEAFMDAVHRITVESSLHLPSIATVVLYDPHLRWIDDDSLAPGKTLKISARSEGSQASLFDGEIVELEPDFEPDTQWLVVRAFDRLHRLARGRHVRSFNNVSDGDVVTKIASDLSLQAQSGPTSEVHDYVLQSNQTDLDFLQGRAAGLGYLVWVDGKTLHFEAPQTQGQAVELEWGKTLAEFHPRMTTIEQLNSVTVRGWNPETRQEVVGQAQDGKGSPSVGESRKGGALAQSAFGIEAQGLVTNRAVRSQTVANQLAQAHADRHASRFIEATGTCGGTPSIKAGASVKIRSVGNRFGGTYFVTSATHTYSVQGYSTEFTVTGQHPANLLSLLATDRDEAPGVGPVIGIVTDNNDPKGQGRVKVKYPWLSSEHASDWARVVIPGGGKERGFQFLPEVNDEVLVGFELGDIHYPYVLGGLWNGQDAPPKKTSEVVTGGAVTKRVIRSRAGHIITLDDTEGAGGVTIEDKNGNKVALESAANTLTIDVKGNGTIKAQGNLTLEATGQMQIKGVQVTVDAGAGIAELKGSLIKLN